MTSRSRWLLGAFAVVVGAVALASLTQPDARPAEVRRTSHAAVDTMAPLAEGRPVLYEFYSPG
ncbi:MAG: hypothetical protein Kow0067_17510 [Coriobacteriia bacterium]|jgi:hypothetical protein